MTGQPLDLAAWRERLGHNDNELFQFCTKPLGGTFQATVLSATPATPVDRDCWVAPNPVEMVTTGRPNAEQVTRLAALWVDLDFKPNGCPTEAIATQIIDTLSGMLGTRPTVITESGHGLQPTWAVSGGSIEQGELTRGEARALLRRWGRLVATVAEWNNAKVDSLYDLPRLLRAPGSVNWKDVSLPVAVRCFADTGGPVDVERLLEVLDEQSVETYDSDTDTHGTIVSAPTEWVYAPTTCHYASTMARGWATDNPGDRHPWLISQAVRVASAHRNQCVDAAGHRLLEAQLVDRFYQLLASDGRKPGRGEISDALSNGVRVAATKTDAGLASELGFHLHTTTAPGIGVSTNGPAGPSSTDHTPVTEDNPFGLPSVVIPPMGNDQALPNGLPNLPGGLNNDGLNGAVQDVPSRVQDGTREAVRNPEIAGHGVTDPALRGTTALNGDLPGVPHGVLHDQATPTTTTSHGEGPTQVDSASLTPAERAAQDGGIL